MRIALSMIALLFVVNTATADGIYVTADKKHAKGDHIVLRLTNNQVKDVERNRKVVLNSEQHGILRKINDDVPNTLRVLTSRWDDCTCGIGIYAIWCRVGELDIPVHEIKYYEKSEEDDFNDTSYKEDRRGLKIVMDARGKMYLRGKLVSEGEVRLLGDKLQVTQAVPRTRKKYIVVDTPPPIDEKIDADVSSLLGRLNEYSKLKDISFHAIGFSFGKGK